MNRKKQRVLLGMSGGVDSSVAGYLLREQGYDVVGVTMKVWPQDCISRAEDKCCGPQAIADARERGAFVRHSALCGRRSGSIRARGDRLFFERIPGWPHAKPLRDVQREAQVRQPLGKGAGARLRVHRDRSLRHHRALTPDRAVLRKGVDPRKDQSYFLFSLRQPQLRHALTPLGRMAKPEIREIARSLGLKVAEKVDSQEICFVPGNDYKAFLRSRLGEAEFHRGGIYDLSGNFIAGHEGIEMFTIGQRKGLPGGSPRPRYVVDIDAATNRVFVGDAEDLLVEEFEIDRINWSSRKATDEPLAVTVKIRYSHPGTAATLIPLEGDRALVRLDEPQKAVTPGQAAVCYEGDIVIAGGWICRQAAVAVFA